VHLCIRILSSTPWRCLLSCLRVLLPLQASVVCGWRGLRNTWLRLARSASHPLLPNILASMTVSCTTRRQSLASVVCGWRGLRYVPLLEHILASMYCPARQLHTASQSHTTSLSMALVPPIRHSCTESQAERLPLVSYIVSCTLSQSMALVGKTWLHTTPIQTRTAFRGGWFSWWL
jgi:hypothetical protein